MNLYHQWHQKAMAPKYFPGWSDLQ